MAAIGSFTSEVYVGGVNFLFDAQFNRLLWSVQIKFDSGERFTSISCVPPEIDGACETIEDAIAEWVHQTVACCVDTYSHRDDARQPYDLANKYRGETSANGWIYASRKLAGDGKPFSGHKRTCWSRQSHIQRLHRQSEAVIQKFMMISSGYDVLRAEINAQLGAPTQAL